VVFIEDLQVKNRSASAQGRKAKPGKQVRQKSGLNRSILDASPFELRRQLEYKTQWNGGLLVAVPPQNTSRRCPECRHTAAQNRKTQTNFVGVECGFCAHADWVGAINIKEAGLASFACSSSSHAANASCQEPTEGMVCASVQPVGIPSLHRGEEVKKSWPASGKKMRSSACCADRSRPCRIDRAGKRRRTRPEPAFLRRGNHGATGLPANAGPYPRTHGSDDCLFAHERHRHTVAGLATGSPGTGLRPGCGRRYFLL
jgi:hypothetical protein